MGHLDLGPPPSRWDELEIAMPGGSASSPQVGIISGHGRTGCRDTGRRKSGRINGGCRKPSCFDGQCFG
nr:unnamed protein product [Digitaria exilis]